MSIFNLPSVDTVARHFKRSLLDVRRDENPYLHWNLTDVLPEDMAVGFISLPIAPLIPDDCGGVRDLDNSRRTFMTPPVQTRYPVCKLLADTLQRPDVARLLGKTCEFNPEGTFLRMEYIQDIDGAWLEPHHDVPAKMFSMVIYLFTGPDAAEWGTDIYDNDRKWLAQASAEFNGGLIFIPGENTWHGYEPRKIVGIRRLIEINYVDPSWRDKEQVCFPGQPITLG